jgi:hypothetical protein
MYRPTSNSCISTPSENWTHVYMNLFIRNSPNYHLVKYLLFLLKYPVYVFCVYLRTNSDLFHLHHNRAEKCLLRGRNWVFK